MKTVNLSDVWERLPRMSKEDFDLANRLTDQYAPVVLPPGWRADHFAYSHPLAGLKCYHHNTGLAVLFSADPFLEPGKTWLHASASCRKRVPTYDELKRVKEVFIGPNLQAIQVFPVESKHINIHPYCLHLWACVEGDGLPDFGREGTI